MPQVLKEATRAKICDAALHAFAECGYAGATMPEIAARAGVATAGLYRYFSSKEILFDCVVPAEVAEQLDDVLTRRLATLGHLVGQARDPQAEKAAERLLSFWVEHRLQTVILLERGEGTRHAAWGQRFVERLVLHAMKKLREEQPGLRLGAPERLVLHTLFENTRRMLARILYQHTNEAQIRRAMMAFWSYQLAGLAGFASWVLGRVEGRDQAPALHGASKKQKT